jgi:murein DD-endopeptidase MepM/ murein hydrolase activator NlpD
MKLFAILLNLFFMATVLAESLPDCKPPACPYVETTNLGTGNLNVRSGAGTNSKVLGLVKQGVVLESRGEKQGDWYPVLWNDKQAFLFGSYAKCLSEKPKEPEPSKYTWTVPSAKKVCQGFKNPISYQTCGFHTGLDICAAQGADIVAIADGKVVHVGPLWLDGAKQGRGPYSVVIDHGDGLISTYGHQSKTIVKVGDLVKSGQKISEIGSLGYSSGPHLHLEVLKGTTWTGNWRSPFEGNACSYYVSPLDYARP